MDPIRRAVFYIVNGADNGRFIRECACSAETVKRVLNLPVIVYTTEAADINRVPCPWFDEVRQLPPMRGPFWYLDSTRYWVQAMRELAEYDQLLYLDVDCFVAWPCMNLFDVLEKHDYALGHSASRDAVESALNVPESFCCPQIGVNVFWNREPMWTFFDDWLALYEEHYARYDENDEMPMRDALWENKAGIRYCTLAPEWCARFDFGGWYKGWVRILHGRHKGISIDREPLGPVAEAINAHCRMRLWSHELIE